MSREKPVLEPLSLDPQYSPEAPKSRPTLSKPSMPARDDDSADVVRCLFCEECFSVRDGLDSLLRHLLLIHKLVIDDVNLVSNVKSYFDYWRRRFKEAPITDYCSVIQTNSSPTDIEPKELYYLLCDALPEDKEIRVRLQQQKLDSVLAQQQMERDETSFSRTCLFCREHFTGNRAALFDHMVQEHNFNVGQADNLVYTNEFLDMLEEKLKSLQCLFCEKTFKDRHVLKEHMRKKQHKKINPQNKAYDRFYIINYLELGKNWEVLQAERDDITEICGADTGDESDTGSMIDEWGDWVDETGASVVCLYCDTTCSTTDKILDHMKDIHHFDLLQVKGERKLTFYQEVKLINYIRRQVHQCTCPVCHDKFSRRDSLLGHMNFLGHVSLVPDQDEWDQPQYFFPTYENDALLCGLDDEPVAEAGVGFDGAQKKLDKQDTSATCDSNVVIAEDCLVDKNSILKERHVREELLS